MTLEELYKIILSDKPSDLIKENEEKIFEMIPELIVCKGFDQHNEWHIYDVYEHILYVVDGVKSDIVLRLAALFHDVGKPIKYTEDENKVGHFFGHWEESQRIFNEFANKYNIDKDITNKVSNLIYYHDLNVGQLDDSEIDKLIDIFGKDGMEDLYELKRSDLLAHSTKYHVRLDDYNNQFKYIMSRIESRR